MSQHDFRTDLRFDVCYFLKGYLGIKIEDQFLGNLTTTFYGDLGHVFNFSQEKFGEESEA